MNMRSLDLLPALSELPVGRSGSSSQRDRLVSLMEGDSLLQAAEYVSGVSFALWGLFPYVNIDDGMLERLQQAYAAQYPGLAGDHSLQAQAANLAERGEESMRGFAEALRGKMAEFDAVEQLEQAGFSDVRLSPNATEGGWDIQSVAPDGTEQLWQVKNVGAEQAGAVGDLFADNPGVNFAVNSEIYDRLVGSAPELADRLMDTGPLSDVGPLQEAMRLLAGNLGIHDIPDGIVDLVPYAGIIFAAGRLLMKAIQTERTFAAADRTTLNKIHVVQTLTLMSRMGVTTVMASAGAAGGLAVGSFVPVVGNLVAGIGGSLAGAGVGMYLNRHLEPHILGLALDITGLEQDDLFYFKNKVRIDEVAMSMRDRMVPAWV